MENQLLATVMASRESYDLIKQHISINKNVSREKKYSREFVMLLDMVGDYYTRDPDATHVDTPLLKELISAGTLNEKHAERFSKIVDDALAEDVSTSNVRELVLRMKKNELAVSLAVAIQNEQPHDKILSEYYELNTLSSLEELIDRGTHIYEYQGVDEIIADNERSAGLTVYPRAINDRLEGGVIGSDHIVIFARPECFTADTDMLTPSGWVSVADVTTETLVGVVDEQRGLVFEKPSSTTVRDDFPHLWNIRNKNGQLDLLVSPGHRMIFEQGGVFDEDTAESISYKQGMKTHTSVLGMGGRVFTAMDALAVAYQADGRTRMYEAHGYSGEGYGYEISLKKKRKIARLDSLLAEAEVSHTKYVDSRGYSVYYIRSTAQFDKDFGWLTLDDVGEEYARAFAKELAYWDGSTRSDTRWKYSSTNEAAIDKAQAVVALAGYNTYKSSVPDKRGYSTCYELHIRSNYTPVDGQSVYKTKVEDTLGIKTYCCSVSTGMVLVRRNGVVSVQGNTGKTGLILTMACGFARQGAVGIVFSNEESIKRLRRRALCCATGMTAKELYANPEAAKDIADQVGFHNIIFIEMSPGDPQQIEALVKRYNAKWFIVDQLRHINVASENRTTQLEMAANAIRHIGKRNNAVAISVTQAGDSASNKTQLDQGDVDSSNTGIPGSCDLMIGIGGTDEQMAAGQRWISLCKNKLGGEHACFPVRFNPYLSKYVSVTQERGEPE